MPLFRYAKRVQNLENDRQLRRSMRKYVGQCDLELTQLLTSRSLKDFERSVLRRLPKSESMKMAVGILETLFYTLSQLLADISILIRPALLDKNFSEGLVFRIVQKFQTKSKSALADDTRVLAEGGEYSVLEGQEQRWKILQTFRSKNFGENRSENYFKKVFKLWKDARERSTTRKFRKKNRLKMAEKLVA